MAVPDLIGPDAIKATLGICIYFLFGSTSGSQKKDAANGETISNLVTQLAQSVPMGAIPAAPAPVVNVHNTTAAPTSASWPTPVVGPNAPLPNIPAVDNSGNLTKGE